MNNLRTTILISVISHGIVLAGGAIYYGHGNPCSKSTHPSPTVIPISIITEGNFKTHQNVSSQPTVITKKHAITSKKKTIKKYSYNEPELAPSLTLTQHQSRSFSNDCKPFIENEYPHYPEEAREQNLEIKFLAHLKINTHGSVEQITFSSQNIPSCFLKATEKALKQWRFHRKKNNIAHISVPIEFVLSKE